MPIAQPSPGGRALLFADDEAPLRLLARVVLESAGYEVLPAGDGREAVELFRREGDRVALALLDLDMPVLGGLAALREMADPGPPPPALLMSGHDPPTLPTDLARHVRGVLAKPFGAEELVRAVQGALGGGV
jgi:two-component system, cell cycle sensor histidine kinase and response regulator CckA